MKFFISQNEQMYDGRAGLSLKTISAMQPWDGQRPFYK